MGSQFLPRWIFHSGGLSKEQKDQNQQMARDVWLLSTCPSPDPFSTLLCFRRLSNHLVGLPPPPLASAWVGQWEARRPEEMGVESV